MFNVFGSRIDIQVLDLLKTDAEGLVLPANDHLWMGAGPALRVKQAGGEAIEVDAVRQGPLALGTAVGTDAGTLALRRIYHAVVMGQDLKTRHDQIAPALAAALQLAFKDRLASLALAPLESEELTGPFHDAAQIVVTALFDALGRSSTLKSVLLVTAKPESRDTYRQAFLRVLGGPHR